MSLQASARPEIRLGRVTRGLGSLLGRGLEAVRCLVLNLVSLSCLGGAQAGREGQALLVATRRCAGVPSSQWSSLSAGFALFNDVLGRVPCVLAEYAAAAVSFLAIARGDEEDTGRRRKAREALSLIKEEDNIKQSPSTLKMRLRWNETLM